MNDVDDFFAEQDRRMSIPDEDVDKYIQTRLAAKGKNQYVLRIITGCLFTGRGRRSTDGRVGDLIEVAPHYPANLQKQ